MIFKAHFRLTTEKQHTKAPLYLMKCRQDSEQVEASLKNLSLLNRIKRSFISLINRVIEGCLIFNACYSPLIMIGGIFQVTELQICIGHKQKELIKDPESGCVTPTRLYDLLSIFGLCCGKHLRHLSSASCEFWFLSNNSIDFLLHS